MRHITDGEWERKGCPVRVRKEKEEEEEEVKRRGRERGLRFIFITSVAICHRLVSR